MMSEDETKMAKYLTVKAIEEYLNNHQYELESIEMSNNTSSYLLLNAYKDELIKDVFGSGRK